MPLFINFSFVCALLSSSSRDIFNSNSLSSFLQLCPGCLFVLFHYLFSWELCSFAEKEKLISLLSWAWSMFSHCYTTCYNWSQHSNGLLRHIPVKLFQHKLQTWMDKECLTSFLIWNLSLLIVMREKWTEQLTDQLIEQLTDQLIAEMMAQQAEQLIKQLTEQLFD